MAISGLRNTTAFDSPSGRRPQNFRETILMLYPNGGGIEKAPLTALTAVMKSEATDDPVFHWFTKEMQDRRIALGANLAATNSGVVENITVVNNSGAGGFSTAFAVKAGDLLLVEQTNEVLYVNATPSAATTISVIRGFTASAGGIAQTAVVYNGAGINPNLKVIGSAYEEGSLAPDPVSFDPVELFNQCQIFRGTYGLTGTAREVRTRTGSEEAEQKREALENFGVDMEMGLWFGQKTTTVRNGKPLRTTQGVIPTIPAANKFVPPAGVLTYDWLEATAANIFRYGSTEKMAFVGGAFLGAISRMVRKQGQGNFDLSGDIKEYGMTGLRRLRTPTGTLVLKIHPLFSQMRGGTTAGTDYTSMDNAAVILDMGQLRYRYLRNRDVKFEKDLQLPGEDAFKAGWIGECGLEMHHPYTHSMISGVVSGAADAA